MFVTEEQYGKLKDELQRFPETAWDTPDNVARVDSWRRQNRQPVSSMGQFTDALYQTLNQIRTNPFGGRQDYNPTTAFAQATRPVEPSFWGGLGGRIGAAAGDVAGAVRATAPTVAGGILGPLTWGASEALIPGARPVSPLGALATLVKQRPEETIGGALDLRQIPGVGEQVKRLPNDPRFPVQDIAAYGLSPASLATMGAGGGLAGIGAAFARNMASITGSIYGGEIAGSKAAGRVPVFGSQPEALRTIEGQLLGGVAGFEAAKKVPGLATKAAPLAGKFNAGEEGAVAAPGRLVDERLRLRPGAAEQGTRRGAILNLRTADQLPSVEDPAYYKRVLDVAGDASRQASSQANILRARAQNVLPNLGKLVKGKDGNWYFKDIAQSPAEAAMLGERPGALATRVLERPGEYALTPKQAEAVAKIGSLEQAVANERAAFGVAPKELAMEEGQQYIHRSAVKPTEATQASILVNQKAPSAELNQAAGGGPRLAIGKDKTRIFADPAEAVALGAVYDHPIAALDQNVAQGLSKAATAHIRDLLTPLSRTSADYVPEGLRAQVEGVRQKIASLKATGMRLTDKQQAAIDDFLTSPGVNLDDFRDVLDGITVGPNAVGREGPNFGKDIGEMRATLNAAKAQLKSLLPEWRQTQDIARQSVGTGGRATVPMQVAPALAGRDFPKPVADALTKFYGRNQLPSAGTQSRGLVSGVKKVNTALIPVKATWDLSSILMQQGRTMILHPRTFFGNLGLSIRDMVNEPAYAGWLASGEADDAARAGIAIQGHAGTPTEFQFNNWFEHVPALGKVTRATNRQFNAFNSRNRVAIFNDYVKANERIGVTLDARAQEQLAVGLNRLTGVSSSRAGDLEQLALFAPNFFRSHIETIGKALADGSIEGQVARRELSFFFGFMASAIGGLAVAQGRDPAEVLNPLDMKALERGQLRLNPNFGTVRIQNEDVNLFGPYVSLARLAMAAGNDFAHAGVDLKNLDTDAAMMKSLAALGELTGTKGSPAAKFATDTIRGETFTGAAPGSLQNLSTQIMPITLANIVTNRSRGFSWHDSIVDALAGAIGANANPTTPTERLSQIAGTDFGSLSPSEKQALLDANPGLAQRRVDQGSEQFQQSEKVRTEIVQRQSHQDGAFISGNDPQLRSLKQWKDAYHDNTLELNAKRDVIYASAGTKPGKDKILDGYFKAIDAATNPKTNLVDWNKVDAYRASLDDTTNAYIDRNTGLTLAQSPVVKEYRQAMKELRDAGYFDMERYSGMRVLSDDEIDQARGAVSAARMANPALAAMDFADAARMVLHREGYSAMEISDAIRAGSASAERPAYARFKARNKDLIAWLNNNLTYEQVKAIGVSR